jgi:hypothetical protein
VVEYISSSGLFFSFANSLAIMIQRMMLRLAPSATIISISLFYLALSVESVQICPGGSMGTELTCAVHCCESVEGNTHGYFCCGVEDNKVSASQRDNELSQLHRSRAERFATYQGNFQ